MPPTVCWVKTLFDFEGTDAEELRFEQGEKLRILKANPKKKWWYASTADGSREGYVPANFVVVLEDCEAVEAGAASAELGDEEVQPVAAEQGEVVVPAQSTSDADKPVPDGAVAGVSATCSSEGTEAEGTTSITSAEDIEELLRRKLSTGVITQVEYDQIMETRRVARELMMHDGLAEFPEDDEVDRAARGRSTFVSPPDPEPTSEASAAKNEAPPRRTSKSSWWSAQSKAPARPKIEVLHSWSGSAGPISNGRSVEAAPNTTTDPVGAKAASVLPASTIVQTEATCAQDVGTGAVAPTESGLPTAESPLGTDPAEEARWRKCASKRRMVMTEVVETERSYVGIIKMLLDVFAWPLRKAADLQLRPGFLGVSSDFDFNREGIPKVQIERHQVKIIFHELESLHAINQLLLEQLESRFSAWGPQSTVGDIFLSVMSFLKGYTAFANNFSNALTMITECKKQASFMAYLTHCKDNVAECQKMWLEDHLITPIQRILRYILLLKDMLKSTPSQHPDFQLLSQCVLSLKSVARHINETKKRSEGALKIIEVQRKVKRCPSIVHAGRDFLYEFSGTEMIPLEPNRAKRILDGGGDAGAVASASSRARMSYVGGSVRSKSGKGASNSLSDVPEAKIASDEVIVSGSLSRPKSTTASTMKNDTTETNAGHRSQSLPRGGRRRRSLPKTPNSPNRTTGVASSESPSGPLFVSDSQVAIYLFSDTLLVASHVQIRDVLGKAYENIKILNRGIIGAQSKPHRPTTVEESGQEIIHKFKYQRMEVLDVVSVSDFPDDILQNGLVIHYPEGPLYYRASSAAQKKEFLAAFEVACTKFGDLREAQIEALHKVYSTTSEA